MQIFLETDRLTLRYFTEEDADHLFELDSDPAVMRFLRGSAPTPLDQIRDTIIPFFLSFYEEPGQDRLGSAFAWRRPRLIARTIGGHQSRNHGVRPGRS